MREFTQHPPTAPFLHMYINFVDFFYHIIIYDPSATHGRKGYSQLALLIIHFCF